MYRKNHYFKERDWKKKQTDSIWLHVHTKSETGAGNLRANREQNPFYPYKSIQKIFA